jgi:hypothetical protein
VETYHMHCILKLLLNLFRQRNRNYDTNYEIYKFTIIVMSVGNIVERGFIEWEGIVRGELESGWAIKLFSSSS